MRLCSNLFLFTRNPLPLKIFHALQIDNIPASCAKADLEVALAKVDGFLLLSLLEPVKFKGFSRAGLACYDTELHAKKAIEDISGIKVRLIICHFSNA